MTAFPISESLLESHENDDNDGGEEDEEYDEDMDTYTHEE